MKAKYTFHRSLKKAMVSTQGRRRFFTGLAVLGIAMLVSTALIATAPEPVADPREEKAWPVSVMAVDPGQLAPVFTTYGRVESNNIAELRTNAVAEVVAVHAREGRWAQQGDLLVELRRDELELRASEREAELAQQRAQLESIRTEQRMLKETSGHYESVWELSQKKLARQQDLLEKRMISQALMDEAVRDANQATIAYQDHVRTLADMPNRLAQQQASVARAEAQWKQALINLDRAEIRAPFSGPVLAVTVAVGDYSSQAGPLVVMADEAEFVIRAPVPNRYVQRLRNHLGSGQVLQSQAEVDGERHSFELDRLGSNVKSGQTGVDAFFAVKPHSGDLPEIGRIVNMTVTLPEEADVVALPVQAIYENDRVYEVADNRLHAITVDRVGEYETAEGQYRVLVRSPELAAGEKVITTQLPRAISGLLVAPIEDPVEQQLAIN